MELNVVEISCSELNSKIGAGDAVRVIDVRQPEEFAICRIIGSELIPMDTIPMHLQELDDEGPELVVVCHHGVRSLAVTNWLRERGVEKCRSLRGGIDAWSREVDSSIPRY